MSVKIYSRRLFRTNENKSLFRLYLHFNKEVIEGLMCVEDVVSDSTGSLLSGGLDEHDYVQHLLIFEFGTSKYIRYALFTV